MRTPKSRAIQQLKNQMYPPKPWVNPLDRGHRFNRLQKYRKHNGLIGRLQGVVILESREGYNPPSHITSPVWF